MTEVTAFDFSILDFIQHCRTPVMDRIMVAATELGNKGLIWIVIAALCAAVSRYRRYGISIAASLAVSMLCCFVLKNIVQRIRPCDITTAVQLLIPRPSDYSFPSGHATAASAAATALFYYRTKLRVPAGILAVLICFSRLYLYVHFPTDVLAGIILGAGCAVFACGTCRKILC